MGRNSYDCKGVDSSFRCRIAEELTYAEATAADTAWLTRSVTVPEATELASRTRGDGLDPLKAWRVTEPRQLAYSRNGDGEVRTSETKTTYEAEYGLPVRVETLEDKAGPGLIGDVSCTALEYVHHTGKNLIGLTKQTLSTATPCATADFTTTAKLASGSRTAYDGGAYGTALADSTRGLATRTWSLKADGSGFQSDGTVEFDSRGRVVKATDPDSKSSTTTYRMEGGQTFGVTETNSLGHSSVQEIEAGRGTATKSTDAYNHVTQSVFDPLGRLVESWGPGRSSSSSSVPDFAAECHIPEVDPEEPDRLPPYVVTRTRGHENRVESSVTVYDGLGRERQTQEEATGGGRLITDTLYNSSGEVWQTNNAYLATGKPSGQLLTPLADTAVPNATRYTYDGLGRVLKGLPVLNGSEMQARSTNYEYGADWSTVINPSGAASYRVRTDSMGRTTQVDTFTDTARTECTSVKYEFDGLGQLVKAYSVERLSGEGGGGKSSYVGLADKCLDLSAGKAAENTPVNLHSCNGSAAQKWSFREAPGQSDPDLGTMTVYDEKWCVEPGSPSAGSGLQIHACDGSADQKIKRNASGQPVHVATALCIAVKDGATANGTSTVLATCAASSAAQKWEAQDETRYVYGPDGSRLLTVQGKQATLHVGETEVTTRAADAGGVADVLGAPAFEPDRLGAAARRGVCRESSGGGGDRVGEGASGCEAFSMWVTYASLYMTHIPLTGGAGCL